MIKTILLGTVLVATLGAGTAFAQNRTITFWNHTFDAQPQQAFVAFAPTTPMEAQPVKMAVPHKHIHHVTGR